MPFTPSGNPGFNTPQVVATEAPTNLNFLNWQGIENLILDLKAVKPDVGDALIPRYGHQSVIPLLKQKLGATTKVIGNSIISHFEEDFIEGRIAVTTSVGGAGAGLGAVYNLATADIAAIGTYAPNVGSATTDVATPFVGAIVLFSNGVEGLITEVDLGDSEFTVFPTQAADTLPAISGPDFLMIKSTAVKEGSSPLATRNSRLIGYQNQLQIIRGADYEITDVAGSEILWFKVPAGNGMGAQNRWTFKGIKDARTRHDNQVERALLDGKIINNPNLANVAPTVNTTEGMIQTIESAGNVGGYTAGAMTLEDIQDLFDAFIRFKGSKDYVVPCGWEYFRDFNRLVREGDGIDLFTAASPSRIMFADFAGGQRELDLDVAKFRYLGIKMALMPLDLFSDPMTYDNVPKYKGLGIFIPVGNTTAYLGEDKSTQMTVPTMSIVTKQGVGGVGTFEYKDWVYGGLGNGSDGDAVLRYAAFSHIGLQMYAVNRYGIMSASES